MHQKIFVSINGQNLDTTPTDSIKIAQCTSCNIIFQINPTSPKKKHNPKRGVGGKGPKTEFMERQLKILAQIGQTFPCHFGTNSPYSPIIHPKNQHIKMAQKGQTYLCHFGINLFPIAILLNHHVEKSRPL